MAKKVVEEEKETGKTEKRRRRKGPFKSDRRLRGSCSNDPPPPLVDSKIPPSPWPFSPESARGKQTEAENERSSPLRSSVTSDFSRAISRRKMNWRSEINFPTRFDWGSPPLAHLLPLLTLGERPSVSHMPFVHFFSLEKEKKCFFSIFSSYSWKWRET